MLLSSGKLTFVLILLHETIPESVLMIYHVVVVVVYERVEYFSPHLPKVLYLSFLFIIDHLPCILPISICIILKVS